MLDLKEYQHQVVELTATVHTPSDTVNSPLKHFASERIAAHTRIIRKQAKRYEKLDE